MTGSQFKAMGKLWKNDCRGRVPTAITVLDKIIGRPALDSLVKSELLEETRVCFSQVESRRFRMTVRGIEQLWAVAQND